MKKKKTKKHIVVAVLVIIIVAIIGFVGYILMGDLKQEDILRNEIKNISTKDITKDRYNDPIKTKDDYAIVEETIKTYLDDYAVTLQKVTNIIQDETLTTMLTAENYQKDGPDFIKSKEYLEKTKKELNDGLNKLTKMTSSENIMKAIENKNLDKYYNDLYKELMLNKIAEQDFETSQKDIKNASDKINNILDVEEQVIDLLIANKGKWSIQNGKIIFQETATLNQYNELCKKITQ